MLSSKCTTFITVIIYRKMMRLFNKWTIFKATEVRQFLKLYSKEHRDKRNKNIPLASGVAGYGTITLICLWLTSSACTAGFSTLAASVQKNIIPGIKLSCSGVLQACKVTLLALAVIKLEHFSVDEGDCRYCPNLGVGSIPSGATISRSSDAVSQN